MIITIFNQDQSTRRTILAIALALSGTLAHRKVAFVDATQPQFSLHWNMRRNTTGRKPKLTVLAAGIVRPELDDVLSPCRRHFREIIIDTDGIDSLNFEAALVASDVLVVPTWTGLRETGVAQELVERIENVRLFNPSLQVLVVEQRTLDAGRNGDTRATPEIRAFANDLLSATLAHTVIHDWLEAERAFESGSSMLDGDLGNQRAATEIDSLYQEIRHVESLPTATGSGIALSNAIHRIMQGNTAVLS